MNRADIVDAYPELIRAAEGPVMDSSCACLMRLAGAVHEQGYKVVLTGEGADEALAGYAWFKTQKIRDILLRRFGPTIPAAIRSLVLGMMGGDRAHLPDAVPDPGRAHRPARRLRPAGPGPVVPLLRRHVESARRSFGL